MKMFDKIRDLFTEEVEVEAPVKKEVIQVEIPAPEKKQEEVRTEREEQPVQPKNESKSVEPKTENKTDDKFNFPVFFDEKDFDDINKEEPHTEEVRKDNLYSRDLRDTREPYGVIKKEEKKEESKFHPTPIISPVYGVLDKNYVKEDIVDKPKHSTLKTNSNITLDEVRNKAYGTLEDELESTLFGKTSIMFATKDEDELTSSLTDDDIIKSEENKNRHEYSDIESDLKDTADALDDLKESNDELPKHKMEESDDTISEYEPSHTAAPKRTRRTRIVVDDDNDESSMVADELNKDGHDLESQLRDDEGVSKSAQEDTISSNNLVEDELNKDFERDSKLSDSDLFNLIDDMYGKGDK